MPGPGPHLMYTLGSGVALMRISDGGFSPHHCLVYSINAFFGPDIGSFSEWLTSTIGLGRNLGSAMEGVIHHPFYYFFILGFPLSLLYNWLSRILLHKGILDSVSRVSMLLLHMSEYGLFSPFCDYYFSIMHGFVQVPLTRWQCFFLVSAGSLSHFFLDHLFEVMLYKISILFLFVKETQSCQNEIQKKKLIYSNLAYLCLPLIYIEGQNVVHSILFLV